MGYLEVQQSYDVKDVLIAFLGTVSMMTPLNIDTISIGHLSLNDYYVKAYTNVHKDTSKHDIDDIIHFRRTFEEDPILE